MEVREPPILIVLRPLVQLALDPEYPLLGHPRLGQRRAAIQRRPPRLPDGCRKPAASLRHVDGFPALGLLRRLRPAQVPSADDGPAHPPEGGEGDTGRFPRSPPIGRQGRRPAFPLTASPRVRRRLLVA